MLKKININIEKDDTSLNDYLFCLSEFGIIPNKISIFNVYDINPFAKFIDTISTKEISNIDIIPTGDGYIINKKRFVKIDTNIYLSFIEYDKESDLGIITDIIIYYLNDSKEKVDSLIKSMSEFIVDYQDSNVEHRFNILTIGEDGLQLDPIDILQSGCDNIKLHYNDDVISKSKKITNLIKKEKKGLSIIYGERGVGKTTLLSNIVSNIDKLCIFIPSNMIDITINSSDFKNFIKRYKNSILIIDDCEMFFTNTYTKSNLFTNNLLQMVDGFSSDIDNLHIIIVLNIEDINDVDPILLDCNNIMDIIEIGRLKNNKVKKLCSFLNQKNKFYNPRLIDVIKKKSDNSIIEMGF